MNAIDRAFIRAYETDERHAGIEPAATTSQQFSVPVPPSHVRAPAVRANAETAQAAHVPAAVVQTPPNAPAAKPAHSTERRPLSAFAAKQTVEARFKPALEVDGFRWSPTCNDLINNRRELLRPLLHTL